VPVLYIYILGIDARGAGPPLTIHRPVCLVEAKSVTSNRPKSKHAGFPVRSKAAGKEAGSVRFRKKRPFMEMDLKWRLDSPSRELVGQ